MAIVKQTDKRTGITYAYETQYYWEKEQLRAKLSLKFIKENIDVEYDNIRMFNNYDDGIATYGYTISTD